MELGIFAKTFPRSTLAETLDAVAEAGVRVVQFNLSCAGLESMPVSVPPVTIEAIRAGCARRGIAIAALSGTYNMIHPDPTVRAAGLDRLAVVVATAAAIGAPIVTLCSGTRDPVDMWRAHPANGSPAAWRNLRDALTRAVAIAEQHKVVLGIEPEPGNVVDSPPRAARLLEECGSDRLGIVIDPANLLEHTNTAERQLTVAFRVLGPHIVLAHAKDRDTSGAIVAPGCGIVPWRRYVDLLRGSDYRGPLIAHGFGEAVAPQAMAFLRELLRERGAN